MSGVSNILVDTNLIILAIGGNVRVRELLEGHTIFISIITEIELLSIPFKNNQDEKLMQDFISNCFVFDLDGEIKVRTIKIRKSQKIKLPDAIIAATSYVNKLPLFTADKDFRKVDGVNVILF